MHVDTRFFLLQICPELGFFKKMQAAFLIYTMDYLLTKNQEHLHR